MSSLLLLLILLLRLVPWLFLLEVFGLVVLFFGDVLGCSIVVVAFNLEGLFDILPLVELLFFLRGHVLLVYLLHQWRHWHDSLRLPPFFWREIFDRHGLFTYRSESYFGFRFQIFKRGERGLLLDSLLLLLQLLFKWQQALYLAIHDVFLKVLEVFSFFDVYLSVERGRGLGRHGLVQSLCHLQVVCAFAIVDLEFIVFLDKLS